MNQILFYQGPNDRVYFITDESDDRQSLVYKKFCAEIFKYPIVDPSGLQDHIDTFHTVLLNINTGEWKRVYPDDEVSFTFDELVKANPVGEEKEKQEKMKNEREVILTKEYFNKVWENKRDKLFKSYGK